MDDQAVICTVHNPTDVLEFLHKKPVDCLLISSAWTITFMLRKHINVVLICDSGRHTFLELWFLGTFRFKILASPFQVILKISSFLKFLLSSEAHSFVQLLLKGQNKCYVFCTFALAQIFFWNEAVLWFLNTGGKMLSIFLMRETKLKLQSYFFTYQWTKIKKLTNHSILQKVLS